MRCLVCRKLQERSNTTFTKQVKSVSKIIIVVPEAGLKSLQPQICFEQTGTHVHDETARTVEPELKHVLQ